MWLVGGYVTATLLLASLPSVQDLALGGRSILLYLAVIGLALLTLYHLR